MKTTLVMRGDPDPEGSGFGSEDVCIPNRIRLSTTICSTICPAVRLPFTPLMPLAQNVQPTGHPTCELTHAVRRSASGIITVSAFAPSSQDKNNFSVPSEL